MKRERTKREGEPRLRRAIDTTLIISRRSQPEAKRLTVIKPKVAKHLRGDLNLELVANQMNRTPTLTKLLCQITQITTRPKNL